MRALLIGMYTTGTHRILRSPMKRFWSHSASGGFNNATGCTYELRGSAGKQHGSAEKLFAHHHQVYAWFTELPMKVGLIASRTERRRIRSTQLCDLSQSHLFLPDAQCFRSDRTALQHSQLLQQHQLVQGTLRALVAFACSGLWPQDVAMRA